MGRDARDDDADDAPISVEQATRAAKTAAAMGRAPKPQATAKIDKFDLDEAIAKSREVDEPVDAATIAPPPDAHVGTYDDSVEVEVTELDAPLEGLPTIPPDDEK